jgi:glycyl-tRNA synthetase beta chain
MPDLLLEIGTEELPATYVPPAIEQLRANAVAALKEHGLAHGEVIATGTPRRLVLFAAELPVAQAARTEEISGPPEKAAFKDGAPTRAASGFAEKNGVRVEDLVVKDTPKGRYLYAVKRIEGAPTPEILAQAILPKLLQGLSFPKSMRWPQAQLTFARPIRRLLCLFGRDVVGESLGASLLRVRPGRTTIGHPFLSGPRELALERADYGAYRALLKGHGVIVDRNERRAAIERDLEALFERWGARFTEHELLEEVTDLVEAPEVMEGAFDEKYLKLPREVIEAAMTDHQRYFPAVAADGALQPRFAFVANRPKDRAALVREGNERVLRARLEDSEFYLREDLKRPLPARVEALRGITFFDKLGTMHEKTERLVKLVQGLAAKQPHLEAARRAALLAKADLTTELVKEFPQLQGAVGAKYAALQGEPDEVARAIGEQYMPRFAGDELPKTGAGTALALAEKLDNLCGFFSLGLVPSGSADPYQLRRQALGVVRIFLERGLAQSLAGAIGLAARAYAKDAEPLAARVREFIVERVKSLLIERGHRYDLVDAALAAGADDLVDLKARLDALAALSKEAAFPDLVELVERTYNISKALDDPRSGVARAPVRPELFQDAHERAMHQAFEGVKARVAAAIERKSYVEAAHLYADALARPVHAFFEKVFVNVEDQAVRANRLSLLREIHDLFARRIADLSKVVEGKK